MKSLPPQTAPLIKALSFSMDAAAFAFAMLITPLLLSVFDQAYHIPISQTIKLQAITFALACCFITYFSFSGQYSKRKPFWGQILSVAKLTFLLLAIDIIVRSAVNYGNPSLYPLIYWHVAMMCLIVFRFVLNLIKMRTTGWKIPAVIIGDANVATHTLFAIASDRGMGYDPKYILMRGSENRSFDKDEAPPIFNNCTASDLDMGRRLFPENDDLLLAA